MNVFSMMLTLTNNINFNCSNGFSQLNGCYTEDTCIPEALILYIPEDDSFYYITNIDDSSRFKLEIFSSSITFYSNLIHSNNIFSTFSRSIFTELLEKNTVICYDGKSVLIFLSHFNFDWKPRSIWDAKVNLISSEFSAHVTNELRRDR